MFQLSLVLLLLVVLMNCQAFQCALNSKKVTLPSVIGNRFRFHVRSSEVETDKGDSFRVVAQDANRLGSGVGRGLLVAYNDLLARYTYPTKMITSAIVGAAGDILVQLFDSAQKGHMHLDWQRLAVFTAVSTFYIAPVIHLWFDWLDKLQVPKSFRENKVAKPLTMLVVDQTVGAVVITAGFFYAFELANRLFAPHAGGSWMDIINAGTAMNQAALWHTLVINWYSWPLINAINFYYVPVQYRLLFSNIAAIFWNMFLSKTANAR